MGCDWEQLRLWKVHLIVPLDKKFFHSCGRDCEVVLIVMPDELNAQDLRSQSSTSTGLFASSEFQNTLLVVHIVSVSLSTYPEYKLV